MNKACAVVAAMLALVTQAALSQSIDTGSNDDEWMIMSKGYLRGLVACVKNESVGMVTLASQAYQRNDEGWLPYFTGAVIAKETLGDPAPPVAKAIIDGYNRAVASAFSEGQIPNPEAIERWGEAVGAAWPRTVPQPGLEIGFMIDAVAHILSAKHGLPETSARELGSNFMTGFPTGFESR